MRLSSKFRNVLLSIKILVLCASLQLLVSCSDGVNNTESNDIRTPQNLIANPGARTVNLNWQGDPAATGYTVYWEVDNAVDSKETANVETVPIPHFEHTALTNGATYYYRVSANKGSKESALSAQVQATPMPLPPEKPTVFDQNNPSTDGFRAFAGNARVTLDWPMDTSEGAIKYTLLWQIGAGVSPDSAHRIEDVVPPFVHQGLDNGQLYSYRLVGVNDEGASEPSDEITATPLLPLPSTPANLRAAETSNPGQITLLWDQFGNADSFELYWSTGPEVSLSSAYVSNLQSPFVHAPLQDGQVYYYKVRAINSTGASGLSGTLLATAGSGSPQQYQPPSGNAPAAPGAIKLQAGDGQVQLKWQPVAGASGYLIYWNTTGNVTEADARVNSAPVNVFLDSTENNEERALYVHTGLTNGQLYYYRIAAYNAVGQTLSSQVGPVRAEKIVPGRPSNVQVIGGDGRIGVRWNPVHNAESYNIYWKQAGFGDEATPGTLIADASSPFTIISGTHELDTNGSPNGAALTNGTAYEIRVEAIAASGAVGCQPQQEIDGVTPKPVPCTDWMEVTPQIPPPAAPDGMRLVPGDGEITVQWRPATSPPAEGIVYRVYSGEHPGIKPQVSDTNGIRQVGDSASIEYDAATQLFSLIDTNLTNGKRHYYIVTASNAGGESLPSRELWAIPQIATPQSPKGLHADSGDKQVTLTWAAPDDITNYKYNIYYRVASNPNPIVIPNAITDPSPQNATQNFNYTVSGLENGVGYYFKVSAINDGGEGVFSSEVNATPYLPPPQQAPSGLTITGGDGQIALSWGSVTGADYYNVYWSTATPINFSNAPRIQVSDGSTDVLHQGLQNGATYYYRITAANAGGESAPSDLLFATAQMAPPASPPGNFTAVAGNAQVRFDWSLVNAAQSYLLYWSTDLNLPINQWVRVSGVEPGYVQSGLTNGVTYHYFLRAANAGGQGPASATVSVTPQEPPPAAPSGFSASAGDATVNVNWDSQAGVSYNLYWSTSPGVTQANSTVVPNVTSTYVHSGLVNDTTYYYRLTAVNASGQSPLSAELSATPAVIPPGAPVGVSAQGRDRQNELRWFAPSGVSATTTYNIYWSTSPGAGTSGTLISNASSPYVHTGLTNGIPYYYVVTAVDGAESNPSLQASATPTYPQVGLPGNLYAQAGVGEVQLTWSAAANAQFYIIYWSNDPNDASPQQIQVTAPATQYRHQNLNNGNTYYYRISAGNLGGISPRSGQVSATPAQAPNQSPVIGGSDSINRSIGNGGNVTIDLSAADTDSTSLTWTLHQAPLYGNVNFIDNVTSGNTVSVNYTHTAANTNSDSFWIRVEDDRGGFDLVQILINIVNQLPVAQDDAYPVSPAELLEGASLTIQAPGLLENDNDPDSDALSVALTPVTDPLHGTLTLNADGSFNYQHDGSETTSDSFEYQISDGVGTDVGLVTITITPVNDAPHFTSPPAPGDQTNTEGDTISPIDASASDVDSATLTYSSLHPINGTETLPPGLNIDANGMISGTINSGASVNSPYSVFITADDGTDSATWQFVWVVNPSSVDISINDIAITEGDATVNAILDVSLSQASSATVTVDYATQDSSALAGQDYNAQSGTVTFDPGVVQQTITIPVIGDTLIEPDESFLVSLANPTNAAIVGGTATVTIVDDESQAATVPVPIANSVATHVAPKMAFNGVGDGMAVWVVQSGTGSKLVYSMYQNGAWQQEQALDYFPDDSGVTQIYEVKSSGSDFIVAYRRSSIQTQELVANIFDGQSWLGEQVLADNTSSILVGNPVVETNGTGYVVAWQVSDKIYASTYQSGVWQAAEPINNAGLTTTPGGIQVISNGVGYLVAWTQIAPNSQTVNFVDVFASVFDGTSWSTTSALDNNVVDIDVSSLKIASEGIGGTYLLAWQQDQYYSIVYDPTLSPNPWGAPTTISSIPNTAYWGNSIVSNGSSYAIIWTDVGTSFLEVWAMTGTAVNGSMVWGTPNDLNIGLAVDPIGSLTSIQIVTNGSGYMAAWVQGSKLYANTYDTSWTSDNTVELVDYTNDSRTVNDLQLIANNGSYAVAWLVSNIVPPDIIIEHWISVFDGSWSLPASQQTQSPNAGDRFKLAAADTRYLIVWAELVNTNHMYSSSYTTGQPDWDPIVNLDQIEHGTSITRPQVVTSSTGNKLMFWQHYEDGAWNYYASVYSNNSWSPVELIDHTTLSLPIKAETNGNGFALIWSDYSSSGTTWRANLYAKRWDGNWQPKETIANYIDRVSAYIGAYDIASDGNSYMVAWGYRGTLPNQSPDYVVEVGNAQYDGASWVVNSTPLFEYQAGAAGGTLQYVDIASNGNGYAVVFDAEYVVYFAAYHDFNTPGVFEWEPLAQVSSSAVTQKYPRIEASDNRYAIVWAEEAYSSSPDYDLIANIYNPGSQSWFGVETLELAMLNTSDMFKIVGNSNDEFMFVWLKGGWPNGTSYSRVFKNGAWETPAAVVIVGNGGIDVDHSVVADGAGGYASVWFRNNYPDLTLNQAIYQSGAWNVSSTVLQNAYVQDYYQNSLSGDSDGAGYKYVFNLVKEAQPIDHQYQNYVIQYENGQWLDPIAVGLPDTSSYQPIIKQQNGTYSLFWTQANPTEPSQRIPYSMLDF